MSLTAMSELIYGDRIGRRSILTPGAAAIIFDEARKSVLLTRRSDNGRWCLPEGAMDPGESAQATCIRETLEETGLQVRIVRLVGIYTNPDVVVEYPDENRRQPVSMTFEAEIIGSVLSLTYETIDYGYFSVDSLDDMAIMEHHLERIEDAVKNTPSAFIK
jgi:8-oxo-dGTP pyrophosphatase MutT (NUDIX family)